MVFCPSASLLLSKIQYERSLVYPGYPLVYELGSLLFLCDFSGDLFLSVMRFSTITNKARIFTSLGYFVDHLSYVSKLLYFSVLWPLLVTLWITCPPPTNSFWYPCSRWRWVTRMKSRGWTSTSQFLSKSHLQWIYCSSILQSGGFP